MVAFGFPLVSVEGGLAGQDERNDLACLRALGRPSRYVHQIVPARQSAALIVLAVPYELAHAGGHGPAARQVAYRASSVLDLHGCFGLGGRLERYRDPGRTAERGGRAQVHDLDETGCVRP